MLILVLVQLSCRLQLIKQAKNQLREQGRGQREQGLEKECGTIKLDHGKVQLALDPLQSKQKVKLGQ